MKKNKKTRIAADTLAKLKHCMVYSGNVNLIVHNFLEYNIDINNIEYNSKHSPSSNIGTCNNAQKFSFSYIKL
jgi:hypothetical protein